MRRIPLGVADDGRLAVVRTREGELVALDPRTGAVRWRRGRALRPCAITAAAVVAFRWGDRVGPGIVVFDAADGRELWDAALPVPPDLPQPALDDPSSFSLDCAAEGDAVLLRWGMRSGYRGGAAPAARVLAEQATDATGAVRIDLRARSVQPATPGDIHTLDEATSGERARAAAPTSAPDVIDHARVGELRLELAAPAGPTAGPVVLRGVDAAAGAVVWEVVLDEQAPRRPPPLRP